MEVNNILDDKYILIKKIGKGMNKKLYLAKEIDTETHILVEILDLIRAQKTEGLNEISISKILNHQNIVKFHYSGKGRKVKADGREQVVNYFVKEYLENGEFFDYINSNGKKGFTESMARAIFIQLVKCIDYCHKCRVAHRDIKPENIFLDNKWNLKLSGFYYSKLITNSILKTHVGTEAYVAPEVMENRNYDGKSADIFQLGIMLFILVTGSIPFRKAHPNDPYFKFLYNNDPEGYWRVMSKMTGIVSEDCKSLIIELLSYDPDIRPSASLILQHQWMKDEVPTYDEYCNEFEMRKMKTKPKKVEKEIDKKSRYR